MTIEKPLEKPLSTCALSIERRAEILRLIYPLIRYLGYPGDWGYESYLGQLTIQLNTLRRRIENCEK